MELPKLIFLFSLLLTDGVVQGRSHHHHHHHHLHHHHHHHEEQNQLYGFHPTKLFVFGDSYADTGNNRKSEAESWKVPYGMNFPGKPSGRFSDGRVLTDYLAKYMGIRTPVAYRWRKYQANRLGNGMNFAYGGTGVFNTLVKDPNMTRQIDFFEELIKENVYTKWELQSSLALVTLAGNDYSYYLSTGGTAEGLLDIVVHVVNQLKLNLKRIFELGLKKVAVANLQPLGCLPRVTMESLFKNCNETDNLAVLGHNSLVDDALSQLNNSTSTSAFSLLDLNTAFINVLFGVETNTEFKTPLKPCCMGISSKDYCGDQDEKGVKKYTVCKNPGAAFFWDYVHPTQAGWEAVFSNMLGQNQFMRTD